LNEKSTGNFPHGGGMEYAKVLAAKRRILSGLSLGNFLKYS
jgi:hypothetical protein